MTIIFHALEKHVHCLIAEINRIIGIVEIGKGKG